MILFKDCEIYHKYTNVDRLTSMTISNAELEAYYFQKLSDIANQANYSMSSIDHLRKNLDCTIHVEVHPNEKIAVLFEKVNITLHRNTSSRQNNVLIPLDDCSSNFLQVYDGGTSEFNRKINYCSTETNQFFKSKSNRIFVRYSIQKRHKADVTYFKITYNPYSQGDCSNSSFKCSDGSCIHPKLYCDGKRNCRSSNDENKCLEHFSDKKKTLSQQPSKFLIS